MAYGAGYTAGGAVSMSGDTGTTGLDGGIKISGAMLLKIENAGTSGVSGSVTMSTGDASSGSSGSMSLSTRSSVSGT